LFCSKRFGCSDGFKLGVDFGVICVKIPDDFGVLKQVFDVGVSRSHRESVVIRAGLRRDTAHFLSLPIPREVLKEIKVLQNDDFAAFVESCRNWK
jgi:hypothetical protein